MQLSQLTTLIQEKGSVLCVGLDLDINKLPKGFSREKRDLKLFLQEIIDATRPYAVAYKPNTAFFESLGTTGWDLLGDISDYIGNDHLKIADAKRGDIGNTARAYAKAFFEEMAYDAITLSPYMGYDSLEPFLEYKDKWAIVLGLTSNPGYEDVQMATLSDGRYLFEKVMNDLANKVSSNKLMFVVGATRSSLVKAARAAAPDHFFLMPGIGAQGGDLMQSMGNAMNPSVGMLINASRSIMYASDQSDFGSCAAESARALQLEMAGFLKTGPY
jgi:orotidine-5'-phosphate decarboxylase